MVYCRSLAVAVLGAPLRSRFLALPCGRGSWRSLAVAVMNGGAGSEILIEDIKSIVGNFGDDIAVLRHAADGGCCAGNGTVVGKGCGRLLRFFAEHFPGDERGGDEHQEATAAAAGK